MHEVKPYHKAHPHSKLLVFEGIMFLAFVVFLFLLLGYATNANAAAVLLAFSPALIFGIAMIGVIQTDNFHPAYNWLILASLLVIFGLIYYLVPSSIVQGLDAMTVLAMNGILMLIALLIMHSSYSNEPHIREHELHRHHEIVHEKKERESAVHNHITQVRTEPVQVVIHTPSVKEAESPSEEIEQVIHSIEDKAKALNFVIGRVYSVYRGGTDRMRNKVRIDKEWYQGFSQLPSNDLERRRAQAIVMLGKVKDRLELMNKSERDVFGEEHTKLKNLARAVDGSDSVLDVLTRNDKDPVKQYYQGALSVCEHAIKKLTQGKQIESVLPRDPQKKTDEDEIKFSAKKDKEGLKRGWTVNDHERE